MEIPALLLFVCLAIVLVVAVPAIISLLIKLGVIIRKAGEPPHLDKGDYSLDQGHEVRSEEHEF